MLVTAIAMLSSSEVNAQEKNPWTVGFDLYSNYIWRGLKLGTGPVVQPTVKYTNGGFTIAGWGSHSFNNDEAAEADIYMSYLVKVGSSSTLTFNLSEYYYPGPTSLYFNGSSHFLEPQLNVGLGKFTFTGAYMSNANATYFEANYSINTITLFAGAGDAFYTKNSDFNLCNLGLKATSAIKINDHFSIPVNGSLVLNPSTEQFHVVVGITIANQ